MLHRLRSSATGAHGRGTFFLFKKRLEVKAQPKSKINKI